MGDWEMNPWGTVMCNDVTGLKYNTYTLKMHLSYEGWRRLPTLVTESIHHVRELHVMGREHHLRLVRIIARHRGRLGHLKHASSY